MADEKKAPQDPASSKADVQALLEEAEAEAAEAEALAAAARARARAARLRREALAQAKAETEAEAEAEAETEEEAPDTVDDKTGTAEPETDDVTETVEAPDTDTTDTEATDTEATDTEDEASDETAEEAEAESKPARRRRLRRLSWSVVWKAAVIVLICAFVAASGYMMWDRHETTERKQRAANFLAGARQGVVNLTSMDFNRAKEDVQRVIDCSTGQFRDDFQARAKDFTTVVEQSKVVTQGTVNAAAVQSINGDFALVLVAATSHVTNAAGAKDAPRNWRLKVTVKDDGGQYKMSNVEFIP